MRTRPEILDLSTIVTVLNNHQILYRLYAVSNHIGPSFQRGHYTAHCLNLQNDKWYLLDDSNVSECSELSKSEIFGANNRDAYILFYERIDEQQRID